VTQQAYCIYNMQHEAIATISWKKRKTTKRNCLNGSMKGVALLSRSLASSHNG